MARTLRLIGPLVTDIGVLGREPVVVGETVRVVIDCPDCGATLELAGEVAPPDALGVDLEMAGEVTEAPGRHRRQTS